MNRSLPLFLCIGLLCGGAVAGCTPSAPDTRFDQNKSLFGGIRTADRLILHEGHPRMVPANFEVELKNKQAVMIRDHGFFPAPLDVTADDVSQLRAILSDEGSYDPWRGEKKCGGFHPDFLAEWRAGNAKYEVLICFGCHEVIVYGPDNKLRCDIRVESYGKLEALLKKYRKHPPEQPDP